MILLPLVLLATALPTAQTATTVFAVRAQVAQTCVVSSRGDARCSGAQDRPAERRVVRSGSVIVFVF